MGTIVLMGGNEFRPECVALDRGILGHIPQQPPRVVVVPTAAAHERPAVAAQNGMRYFDALGANSSAAMIVSRADANNAEIAAQFELADVVYLTGGNPWVLLDTLRNSRCWVAIERVWRSGGVVAGSSAGAMVLADRMWWNGQWTVSLGLAPRIAVLPHHRSSGELRPGAGLGKLGLLTILGIPEATACLSEYGHVWSVVGQGKVVVYTDAGARVCAPGETFTLAEGER
jgi:cyanophycinase